MTPLLDPRRHHAAHSPQTAMPMALRTMEAPGFTGAAAITARTLPHGQGRVEANAGGGVCILQHATRAQLLDLRRHLDAAIAAAEAREAAGP